MNSKTDLLVIGGSADEDSPLDKLDSNTNNSDSDGNMKSKTVHISVKEKRARELGIIIWDESQWDHYIKKNIVPK